VRRDVKPEGIEREVRDEQLRERQLLVEGLVVHVDGERVEVPERGEPGRRARDAVASGTGRRTSSSRRSRPSSMWG
jgi:hypothetical protein